MTQLTPKRSREDWRAQMTPKPRSRASIHHQVVPQMTPKVHYLMVGGTQLTPKSHVLGYQFSPNIFTPLCSYFFS